MSKEGGVERSLRPNYRIGGQVNVQRGESPEGVPGYCGGLIGVEKFIVTREGHGETRLR